MKIRIAVVQLEIKDSLEKNLDKVEKYIEKASRSKSNIIVFPEYLITVHSNGRKKMVANYRAYFQRLARKYRIDIVPGSIIEKEKNGSYNTTYYIDSRGRAKARYRKVNLWLSERSSLKPGKESPVFNTKYGKIGLTMCWDLMFPENFRKMTRKGVKIVFCPSFWTYGNDRKVRYDKETEIRLVDSLCVGRAFENEIVFVYCNAAGKKDKLIGHSQITIPLKGCVKKLGHNKEEMFIQEVDTDLLRDAERFYKIRKDLKTRALC
jgi:predicted amidohydrolase